MEKQRWRTELWTQGQGRGARVRCMENNMEIYITTCKTASQWEFVTGLRELKQRLCDNLEGWNGEGSSAGRGHGCTYG